MGGGGGDFSDEGTAKAKAKKKASAARTKSAANTAAAAKGAKPGANLNPQAAPYRDPGAPSKGKPAAPPGGQFGPIPFGKPVSGEVPVEPTQPPETVTSEEFPTQLAQRSGSSAPRGAGPLRTSTAGGGGLGNPQDFPYARQASGFTRWGGMLFFFIPLLAVALIAFLILRGEEHLFQRAVKKMKKRAHPKHH